MTEGTFVKYLEIKIQLINVNNFVIGISLIVDNLGALPTINLKLNRSLHRNYHSIKKKVIGSTSLSMRFNPATCSRKSFNDFTFLPMIIDNKFLDEFSDQAKTYILACVSCSTYVQLALYIVI